MPQWYFPGSEGLLICLCNSIFFIDKKVTILKGLFSTLANDDNLNCFSFFRTKYQKVKKYISVPEG